MSTMTSSSANSHNDDSSNNRQQRKRLTDFSIETIIGPNLPVHQEPLDSLAPSAGRPNSIKTMHRHDQQDQQKQQLPTAYKKYRPKNFQCPTCKMAFSNNGQLKNHVRIHTGERPFRCNHPDCNKTFTRNEELTRHKLIHTGVRPHVCTSCGKRFGRKDHLKKHVRTHNRKKLRKKVFVPTTTTTTGSLTTMGQFNHIRDELFAPPKPIPVVAPQMAQHFRPTTLINSNFSTVPFDTFKPPTSTTSFLPPSNQINTSGAPPSIPMARANSATTTTTSTSTIPINSVSTQFQQLASDYLQKWYNFMGIYQQQYICPSANLNGLTNLFRRS